MLLTYSIWLQTEEVDTAINRASIDALRLKIKYSKFKQLLYMQKIDLIVFDWEC